MFIKRLAPNIYDVFLDKGWDKWTRVKRNHWGVSVLKGNRLPRGILKQVAEKVQ